VSFLINFIDVKEEGNWVIFSGFTYKFVHDLFKGIEHTWGTSKITTHLFRKASFGRLMVHKFFLIDLVYILNNVKFKGGYGFGERVKTKLLDVIYEKTWFKSTLNNTTINYNEKLLQKLNGSPLPHSDMFFNQYINLTAKYKLNGYVLGSPPGTGKTYMNLALGVLLDVDVHICVVPGNAVDLVWATEIKKWIKAPKRIWTSTSGLPITSGYDYYILHYEYLSKFITGVKSFAKYMRNPMISLDESHNFNEMTAQRTVDFIHLCKLVPTKHVIWSSGTPIKAMGREVIPMLKTIDPLFDNKAEEMFAKIYAGNKTQALDILAERMGLVLFSVDKKEVVNNEKEITDILVKIPNSDEYTLDAVKVKMLAFVTERTEYYKSNLSKFEGRYHALIEQYEKTIRSDAKEFKNLKTYVDYIKIIRKTSVNMLYTIREVVSYCNLYEKKIARVLGGEDAKEFKDVKTIYKYLVLKIKGEALGRVVSRLRIDCALDMIPYIGLEDYIKASEKKSVIFTDYVEAVDKTRDYLTHIGFKPLVVYGKTNNELTSIVSAFDKDEAYNPLIATYKSLSTAVPLTMANSIIMLNAPFRSYILNQAVSRVDRKGQDSIVRQYTCVLDTDGIPNISSRNLDIMKWSEEQVAMILGIDINTDSIEPVTDEVSVAIEGIDFYDLSQGKKLIW